MPKIKTITEKDAPFVFSSIKERMALAELGIAIPEFKLTNFSDEEGFDSWDCIYKLQTSVSGVTGNTTFLAEAKIRKHSSAFHDGKWIFELKKFDAIHDMISGTTAQKSNIKIHPAFIIFFTDCTAIWDFSYVQRKDFWEEQLRHRSVGGNSKKTLKRITHMDIKDAHIFNFIINPYLIHESAYQVFKFKFPNSVHLIPKKPELQKYFQARENKYPYNPRPNTQQP